MEMECLVSVWKGSLQTLLSLTSCKRISSRAYKSFQSASLKSNYCAELEGRWTLFYGRMYYGLKNAEAKHFMGAVLFSMF
jgi:hypothetical protein